MSRQRIYYNPYNDRFYVIVDGYVDVGDWLLYSEGLFTYLKDLTFIGYV